FHQEQDVCNNPLLLSVKIVARFEDDQIGLGFRPIGKPHWTARTDHSSASQRANEKRIASSYTHIVAVADRAHLYDLSVNELDAILGMEDAGICHLVILVNREQLLRDLGFHADSPFSIDSIVHSVRRCIA